MKLATLKAATIAETQQNLVSEFAILEDWMERYKLIIELGQQLPTFPDEWKTDTFKIQGCQSQVWIKPEIVDGKLVFHAASDAAIVSGLIAILLLLYSDRLPGDILAVKPEFIAELGLQDHLSPTRSNGLYAMLKAVINYAFALQSSQGATS